MVNHRNGGLPPGDRHRLAGGVVPDTIIEIHAVMAKRSAPEQPVVASQQRRTASHLHPRCRRRPNQRRDHVEDLKRIDRRLDEITAAVKASGSTVIRVYGVGPVNAGIILGEVGDIGRFPTRNHFASYTGTAPIAVSSGDNNRHRLSRSGNRRLNHAIHIAAITQVHQNTPGREYYLRKLAAGQSRREALRCVKRRISDAIWRQLQLDRQDDQTQDETWPRWPSKRGLEPSYRSPDTPRRNGLPKQHRPAEV